MKSILLSIKPKWVAKILNGEKTIEVRKKFPKDYVGWVYIYCTEDNDIYRGGIGDQVINGKVVARFWCDKVEEINRYCTGRGIRYKTKTLNDIEICDKSCLDLIEIDHYLYFKKGYAIHITKLEIFDKPKELYEFQGTCNKSCEANRLNVCKIKPNCNRPLTKAPQNYCYVEVEK